MKSLSTHESGAPATRRLSKEASRFSLSTNLLAAQDSLPVRDGGAPLRFSSKHAMAQALSAPLPLPATNAPEVPWQPVTHLAPWRARPFSPVHCVSQTNPSALLGLGRNRLFKPQKQAVHEGSKWGSAGDPSPCAARMQGAAPDEAQGAEAAAGQLGQEAVTEVPPLPAEEVAASIGAAVSGDPVCEAVMAAQELSQLVLPGPGEPPRYSMQQLLLRQGHPYWWVSLPSAGEPLHILHATAAPAGQPPMT